MKQKERDTSVNKDVVRELTKTPTNEFTDKHYDFKHFLTEEDKQRGYIMVDAYFVCSKWKLFERDGGSGILFHCLKTILRIGLKAGNTVAREISAIKKQLDNLPRFL